MRRRTFTVLSALGGLAILNTWGFSSCSPDEQQLTLAIPESLLPICDPTAIAEIGKHYLLMVPEENNKKILESRLMAGYKEGNSSLPDHLQKEIVDEYNQGDMVEVNGWLLARTEARQSALYKLLKP